MGVRGPISKLTSPLAPPADVSDTLVYEQARVHAAHGVKVLRFWAYSNGASDTMPGGAQPIQPHLGTFNEAALRRLDLAVAACKYYGIKVVLTLANYEPNMGGIQVWPGDPWADWTVSFVR